MRRAFTLVELMIVVAIVGILAAIAIPNFSDLQYRSKRAELPTNVQAIKTAEAGYEASYDAYLPASQHPASTPGKKPVSWAGGSADWQHLGWSPDGSVRGRYSVTTAGRGFVVTGISDMDGDGVQARYTATSSVSARFQTDNDTF